MSAPFSQAIKFPCPQCGRILSASEILRGTDQKCPHCLKLVAVPDKSQPAPITPQPPIQTSAAAPPLTNQPQPAAEAELWAPGEAAPAEQATYVPVHCRVCDTRMYASVSQVGGDIVCPDCGAKTKVKMVASKIGVAPPISLPGEGYELHEPPPPVDREKLISGSLRGLADDTTNRPDSLAATARADQAIRRKRRRPPKNWMLRGVFLYPFQFSILTTSVLVSCLVMGIVYLTRAIDMFSDQQITAIFAVFCIAIDASLVAFAGGTLATLLMAIVEVSSDGQDNVQEELEGMFADKIYRMLFIMAAWVFAAAPGMLIDFLAGSPESWKLPLPVNFSMASLASILILLPWTQLSVLEASSLVVPISFQVVRGARRNLWAWGAFYLVSWGATAVAVGLIALASFIFNPVGHCLMAWIAVLLLIVYYRLLGRLAWYCAENTPPSEEKHAPDPYEPLYP